MSNKKQTNKHTNNQSNKDSQHIETSKEGEKRQQERASRHVRLLSAVSQFKFSLILIIKSYCSHFKMTKTAILLKKQMETTLRKQTVQITVMTNNRPQG